MSYDADTERIVEAAVNVFACTPVSCQVRTNMPSMVNIYVQYSWIVIRHS